VIRYLTMIDLIRLAPRRVARSAAYSVKGLRVRTKRRIRRDWYKLWDG